MNYSVYLILLVIKCFLVNTSTGIPNNVKGESRIVGGHDSKPHSHPYIVSLQTRILYLRMHVCGGVLINEYFILSAAHCATESWLLNWLPMDAVAGIHDVNRILHETQIIKITDRIVHPRYNGGIGAYDIGLYKTIRRFRFTKTVQPIKLSTSYNYKSNTDSLRLVGWGALRTTLLIPDLPTYLQEVNVSFIPFKECYETIEELKEIGEENPLDEDSNLCTGAPPEGVSACIGDSGGPLVQIHEINNREQNDNGNNRNNDNAINEHPKVKKVEALLLGIVSWGLSPCGQIGAPTVYTNVSAFTDFINYNLQNA